MHREPTPMDKRIYISVILPLRLEWEPCYWTDIEDIGPGQRVRVLFAGREYTGTVSAAGIEPQLAPSKIQQVISREDNMAGILPEEIRLWRIMAGYYMCTVGEVYKTAYPAGKINSEKSLAKKKAALQEDGQKRKGKTEAGEKTDIGLSSPQQAALQQIQEAFSHERTVLLNGVTGSGKTEIYISLASETLSRGKDVLYLVPEKAMSRQLEERLRRHFGDSLLTFHSGETASCKAVTADRLRTSNGKSHIVLGTRSAIFLPFHGLGLVVVDEEHDSSYKQDSPAPRYNGRDVAVMLATIHGCPLVMGSATPSLESVFNAGCGKYAMLNLDTRFYRAREAAVEIIDTSAERRKNGMTGSFSKKLVSMMEKTLQDGEQVLILRARRAFSPVLQCPECGEILKCPHCNVSLSLHKNPDRMMCHHCGYSAAFDPHCPKCGAVMHGLGSGTQKIEEETQALFPGARIGRLDSDTSGPQAVDIINKFNAGETDILIGTQIVSKGFDFPGLTLAAVIAADSLLGVQDFRADEKAFQILEQLRGRCGRREKQGVFMIQTNQPDHPVYRQLAEGNGDSFYRILMSERSEFGYPPFTRIMNLSIKDEDETRVELLSARLSGVLKTVLSETAGTMPDMVSDPFRPPVDRISGNHIRIIRLTLKKDRHLHDMKRLAARTVSEFEKKARCQGHVTIDVDPY